MLYDFFSCLFILWFVFVFFTGRYSDDISFYRMKNILLGWFLLLSLLNHINSIVYGKIWGRYKSYSKKDELKMFRFLQIGNVFFLFSYY